MSEVEKPSIFPKTENGIIGFLMENVLG